MKAKRILAAGLAAILAVGLMACGGRTEDTADRSVPTAEAVAGEYSFTENVSFNGASFETPWTLELNTDGTYHLTSEGAVACDISGDFTVDDATTVTTGVPTETDYTILADFFEDDYSCHWTLDVDAKTATPVNYSGATEGASDAANTTGLAADFENVAYASTSDSQVCNIYLPKEGENFPVIVLVHGGGFKFGDQTMELIQPVIAAGVENGYAVVSVDYRKSGEAQFPAALADVKAAVRFVKANASEYGFDADNVAIWGESAGAYLSLMTALTPEVTDLNGDVTDNLDYDSSVKALVDFYGPVEFYTMKEEYEAMGNNDAGDGAFESDFVGVADIYADKDACDKTYWETYKSQIPADFSLGAWIQVGDENDTNVPYTQSVNFSERLQSVSGVTVSFEQIAGAGHEDDAFYTDENLAKVFDFLAGYVK